MLFQQLVLTGVRAVGMTIRGCPVEPGQAQQLPLEAEFRSLAVGTGTRKASRTPWATACIVFQLRSCSRGSAEARQDFAACSCSRYRKEGPATIDASKIVRMRITVRTRIRAPG